MQNAYGQTIHVLMPLTVSNPNPNSKLEFVHVYQNSTASPQESQTGDRSRERQMASFPGQSWIFSGCILRETTVRGSENVIKETFVPLEAVTQLKTNIESIEDQLEKLRPHEVRRATA